MAAAFAIGLARPLPGPHLPSRIIGVEVQTAERRPTAVRTAFDVAAMVVTLADSRAAIGTGGAAAPFQHHSSLVYFFSLAVATVVYCQSTKN